LYSHCTCYLSLHPQRSPKLRFKTAVAAHAGIGGPNSVLYDNYRDPMYPDALAKPFAQAPALNQQYAREVLGRELYRCGPLPEWCFLKTV
jgi:hypothetical protein